MNEKQQEIVDRLKRALDGAPEVANSCVNLIGWRLPEDLMVCGSCSARIFARGCTIPTGADAIWDNDGVEVLCCTCHNPPVIYDITEQTYCVAYGDHPDGGKPGVAIIEGYDEALAFERELDPLYWSEVRHMASMCDMNLRWWDAQKS